MKINTDPQQNKYHIREIESTSEAVVLHTETEQVSLPYEQVELKITVHVGTDSANLLETLQNTLADTSAEQTLHSFHTFRQTANTPSVTSIDLLFCIQEKNYLIPMEGLVDLLLDFLKEKHPFKKISYRIGTENSNDPDQEIYKKKLKDRLDKVFIPAVSVPAQPVQTQQAPASTSSKKVVAIVIGLVIVVALAAVCWMIKG